MALDITAPLCHMYTVLQKPEDPGRREPTIPWLFGKTASLQTTDTTGCTASVDTITPTSVVKSIITLYHPTPGATTATSSGLP